MTDVDDVTKAAIDLVGHTGAESFSLRYSEEEDEPTIWIAYAKHKHGEGYVITTGSDLSPLHSVLDLCDKLIDGGICTHCGKVTILEHNWAAPALPPIRMGDEIFQHCTYKYDPELNKFRRSCEGEAP